MHVNASPTCCCCCCCCHALCRGSGGVDAALGPVGGAPRAAGAVAASTGVWPAEAAGTNLTGCSTRPAPAAGLLPEVNSGSAAAAVGGAAPAAPAALAAPAAAAAGLFDALEAAVSGVPAAAAAGQAGHGAGLGACGAARLTAVGPHPAGKVQLVAADLPAFGRTGVLPGRVAGRQLDPAASHQPQLGGGDAAERQQRNQRCHEGGGHDAAGGRPGRCGSVLHAFGVDAGSTAGGRSGNKVS